MGDLEDDAHARREIGRLVARLPPTEPRELADSLDGVVRFKCVREAPDLLACHRLIEPQRSRQANRIQRTVRQAVAAAEHWGQREATGQQQRPEDDDAIAAESLGHDSEHRLRRTPEQLADREYETHRRDAEAGWLPPGRSSIRPSLP